MSSENVLWAVMGFLLGAITMMALQSLKESAKRKSEEDDEQNDPANWWKYGKDPFESHNE